MAESGIERTIKLCNPEKCTGCSACVSICPTQSIAYIEDEYAEIHPVINNTTCVACRLCQKVCPQLDGSELKKSNACYAAWRNDNEERINSSSGGIAALLYERLLDKNYICYGVKFDVSKGAYFARIFDYQDVETIKGSKYVQASIENVFQEIGENITNNKQVLFVGTPCQTAGLDKFINIKYSQYRKNVVLVDFLCHGTVPGKYLLEEIHELERNNGFSVDSVSFRSNIPNRNYRFSLYNQGKVLYSKKAKLQPYFYGFLKSYFCRESCINCEYKSDLRVGDITIGDFIGLGKLDPIKIPNGINPSVVLTNTSSGDEIIHSIQDGCTFIERDIHEAIMGGPSFNKKNIDSDVRRSFRRIYKEFGYSKATQKVIMNRMIFDYCFNYISRFFEKVKRKIKKVIRLK